MPVEDDWEMEPCLRKWECEPARNGGDWKCGFCGTEMIMMRVLRPKPEPTAAELAERQAQAERLVAMLTDPGPGMVAVDMDMDDVAAMLPEPEARPGALPGETDEELISRIFAEVRAEPEPKQNAGGPGCWRTEEPAVDIGRTHGWENFGAAVEQLKKEGL